MNHLKILLAAYLILVSFAVPAGMTVETYLRIQKIADGNSGASETAKVGRMQFLLGVSDTFRLVAGANNNKIFLNGVPTICLPSDDVLTIEIISSSIRRIIGTPDSPTTTGKDWKDLIVTQAAFLGLTQTFPCVQK